MVNLPPLDAQISSRDEPSAGGVICKLQDQLMTGGTVVGLQGCEEREIYWAKAHRQNPGISFWVQMQQNELKSSFTDIYRSVDSLGKL